ncbi:hypothetical protein BD289DRAFT_201320 [Coniella lustricola]|uniref:Pre-mRNA splicing factor CLF1 n=1 Tax=Coniella lustricola TaxID=2025994 RepID=A0A2T3ACF0_9PEZI|nr:hypothetical protein BD289DRAFT_201320 [Coniella lustricola]
MTMLSQPKPKVALNNECSAVHNNTLFTYQASAFQSLELVKGAEWKTLDQGEALSGAACVNVDSTDASQAALWIVGGTGGSSGYEGLQKYTYSTGKWESITPVTAVTENRTDHAATYLSGWNAIVVYAGSQDGSTSLSTQTFSISLTEPYSVLAYESDGAPPTSKPILLPWSDTEAVMVGGSSDNTAVMLFEVGAGWSNSGATLASPLKTGSDGWHASLVTGIDGSKSLYTYDMTVSPNIANRTLVVDEHGAPVSNAVAITKRWEPEGQAERRDANALTATTWPTYNNTYASSATRTDSSAAVSSDGMVVLSGGNMDDVICLFDQSANSWINATELLATTEHDQKPVAQSSTSSESASATSSIVASSTASAGALSATAAAETTAAVVASSSSSSGSSSGSSSSSSSLGTNQILGVVLGSMGGAIVLLLLVYCQIRGRKRRIDFIQAGHARRASGDAGEPEKDGMAMAMATESFPRSPTNPTFMRGHQPKGSTSSFSSLAIMMGKTPKPTVDGISRPPFGKPTLDNGNSKFISGPMPAIAGPPLGARGTAARDEKGVSFSADTFEPATTLRVPANQQDGIRRSSGWNRYWSGESGALNILGYGNNNNNNATAANRNTVTSEGSRYSTNDPGVNLHNRRTQDSATVPPLNVIDGPPRFGRVNSGSPTTSNYPSGVSAGIAARINNRPHSGESDLSGYSSGIPASVHDSWDPTALTSRPFAGGRATSSMYSTGFPLPPGSPGQQPPMPRYTGNGISQQPQLAEAHTSDMSWLNLGDKHNRL